LRALDPSDNLSGHPKANGVPPGLIPRRTAISALQSRLLDLLRSRVLFYDGGMGTQLQARELTAEDFGGARWEGCIDYLSLTRPDVVETVHSAYFEAGADIVETNSFQASGVRLAEWGLGERTVELNRAAAAIARRTADRFEAKDGRPRFVAGSMGPSGMLPSSEDPDLGRLRLEDLLPAFADQAQGLLEGGADVLILETCQDILEMKAQILASREAFTRTGRRVPIQCSVTLDPSGRMLLGTDIRGALATLEAMDADIIGLNCSTGPDLMRDAIRYLSQNSRRPIHCIPNAGLPINDGGRTLYPMQPDPMAETLREFVSELGVNIIGGCCGTTPAHIRAMVAAVGRRAPTPRAALDLPRATGWSLSSGMTATALEQEPRPLLIGERLNTQGSRKIKRLALEDRIDEMIPVAREQVDGGAHALDVCMALTERTDEAAQVRRLVKKLALSVEAPLVIDSTEAPVIEEALRAYPGCALVNSINMENGRERIDAVMPLVMKYGAAVIALTIDPVGMAKTAARKLEVARTIHDIVTGEYGLPAGRLVFDDLTFTLATGDDEFLASGIETIEGIRLIKRELPGVLTSLGVSNVSFGLGREARAILNSVFLYHCVQAGLDMAIVNPADITPYAEIGEDDRRLAEDLIFNRNPQALSAYIAHFENRAPDQRAKEEEAAEATMSIEEKIHYQILHRKPAGIEDLVDAAVKRQDPVTVLNTVLLPAMKEVGDKFGAGELILPFVLQSAEVMKKAVARLETYLEKNADVSKGRVVVATVYGDVHDIGKNLVKTILSNNGYTVFDLGKQVPVQTILDKANEVGATAIGLSALLVSTSRQMPICVGELHRAGLRYPVLIGGAAINRNFGRRAALVDGEVFYEPGVFYCKDAFEGLDTMNLLIDGERRPGLIERIRREAFEFKTRAAEIESRAQESSAQQSDFKVTVSRDVRIPAPPFWGPRVVPAADIPFDGMFAGMDLKTLYRLHWGARGSGEEFDRLIRDDFEPRRLALQKEAEREGWLTPRSVYGYFPCQSDGQDLVIFEPTAFTPGSLTPRGKIEERLRFTFPRQADREGLCLSDYFQPKESSKFDVVAFQVVTVGPGADLLVEQLNARGEYAMALFVHGLGVSAAEGLAEWQHRRIREELKLEDERGKRYSFGYSACPELADQAKLFELLKPESAIGVTLTSAYQLVPEASTSALIVHHPAAVYYMVKV
jgi:5-methyltetrahydrofolate--homocysteine methyltransferase